MKENVAGHFVRALLFLVSLQNSSEDTADLLPAGWLRLPLHLGVLAATVMCCEQQQVLDLSLAGDDTDYRP